MALYTDKSHICITARSMDREFYPARAKKTQEEEYQKAKNGVGYAIQDGSKRIRDLLVEHIAVWIRSLILGG